VTDIIASLPAGPESILVEETGAGRYQVEAHAGGSVFLIDEPIAVGGLGTGPNPYDLISVALGSCTAMTVRLYANRKQWPLERVRVRVVHIRGTLAARDRFEREIEMVGALDDAQRARLMEIAMRCPVHLTLERGADVRTTQAPPDARLGPDREAGQHMRHMVEACAEPG
jgi:putative redox protein